MNALAKKSVSKATAAYEKVVIVTRRTQLEELVARFNTVPQAQFYLEHAGQDFMPIAAEHQRYQAVLDGVRGRIPEGLKQQIIERSFLPQFKFGESDLVITIGPDGLVVNTAKYLNQQPILAVNPDPESIDGVLLPFDSNNFDRALELSLQQELEVKPVTMVETQMSDGQRLLGFNDMFIGAKTHVSARYDIAQGPQKEYQSSSGIIVSTGAGSTGWLQSVYTGAARVIETLGGQIRPLKNGGRLPWDSDHLIYAVREPFPSKVTGTRMSFGVITKNKPLVLISRMSDNGVIFSDGIEADYLRFNAGTTATIRVADQKAHMLVN